MKIIVSKDYVTLHVSGNDTLMWAMRPNNEWPCSTLAGNGFTAEFDSNGLCDFDLKGTNKNVDEIDGHELSAICCDLLKNRLPKTHSAYDVAVGQFLKS
jgi:hypothetical protein